ncbi:MAG: hypothetical protein ABF331_06145 [Hellea sp.]
MVVGCKATQPYIYNTIGSYNSDDVRWSKLAGDAKVFGSSFLRQSGGGVVSCAGTQVGLIPASSYADERISYLYGNLQKGYNPNKSIDIANSSYINDMRITTCDVDGKFEFNNIPAGVYYLTTRIEWMVGYRKQGGALMQRLEITEGESKRIVLTM